MSECPPQAGSAQPGLPTVHENSVLGPCFLWRVLGSNECVLGLSKLEGTRELSTLLPLLGILLFSDIPSFWNIWTNIEKQEEQNNNHP